jgi:hypothetical protein
MCKAIIITFLASLFISTPTTNHPTIHDTLGFSRVQVNQTKTLSEPVYKPRAPLAVLKTPVNQKPSIASAGSCSEELKKYGWNQSVAYNVMMVESHNNPLNLNDNPNTGDYSVGCFQINLLGGNLNSKYDIAKKLGYPGTLNRTEMTNWLWDAENNVAVAHALWQGSGWGPWSNLTCKKVACY